jgi:predicted SAM-dependent methyltransferase
MSVATDTAVKLDLACGQSPQEGFTGVDYFGEPDVQLDLFEFPWPWETSSVDEVFSSHFVEHIPHRLPEWPRNVDGLDLFMDECWRILKPGGTLRIIHPYGQSSRALQDRGHERYLVAESWWYYNRKWREATKLDHYPIRSDFSEPNIANGFLGDWENRSDSARQEAAAWYWNVVSDLVVTLTAIKEVE